MILNKGLWFNGKIFGWQSRDPSSILGRSIFFKKENGAGKIYDFFAGPFYFQEENGFMNTYRDIFLCIQIIKDDYIN